MTGLDATIARALSGYNAGDVLSFNSLREAANAAQLSQQQTHGQILHALHAGYIKPMRFVIDGIEYDLTRPTEHGPGVHRLIRHYRRTDAPVVVGVAS